MQGQLSFLSKSILKQIMSEFHFHLPANFTTPHPTSSQQKPEQKLHAHPISALIGTAVVALVGPQSC